MRPVALLLCVIVARSTFAQAPATGGYLEGRVRAANGDPVPRAIVRLSRSGPSVAADDEGKFVFSDVPPGRYTLGADKAGFLRPDLQWPPLTTVSLSAGSRLENVVVTMTPQAVIAGKVADAVGDPFVAGIVTPLQYRYLQGRRQLDVVGPVARTDDQGNYRLSGLAPGRYYLRVSGPPPTRSMAVAQPSAMADVVTYYPSGLDAADVRPLDVAMGAELHGVDVQIRRVGVFTVSGSAVHSLSGAPPVRSMLVLIPRAPSLR